MQHRYLLEHGLKPDGFIDPDVTDEAARSGSYETFFTETSGGKYVPRSIFVDLDPSVCDRPQTCQQAHQLNELC
jgi:tubulin alpha